MSKIPTPVDPTEWQVAPAEFQLQNYDQHKIQYRASVESYIKPLNKKSIKKKAFFTISTNVLCAETKSSKESIPPVDRDIYQPLEISITKWSFTSAKDPVDRRILETKFWMINPGEPTYRTAALDHKAYHKIDLDFKDTSESDYIENDLNKVVKEINSFLTAERLVFSLSLKYARQDLGCLKWLNRETGYRMKAIKVFSLEDLYIVIVRHLKPDTQMMTQGIVRFRFDFQSDTYNTELQCAYHRAKAKIEDGECRFCARCLSISYSNVIIDDVSNLADFLDSSSSTQPIESSISESIRQIERMSLVGAGEQSRS